MAISSLVKRPKSRTGLRGIVSNVVRELVDVRVKEENGGPENIATRGKRDYPEKFAG